MGDVVAENDLANLLKTIQNKDNKVNMKQLVDILIKWNT